MKILATTNYSYSYPTYNKFKATNPNFKGAMNNNQTKKALKMLQAKLTDVRAANNIDEFKKTVDNLGNKYAPYGNNSVGAMLIPNDELAGFIGEKACKEHSLKDKVGICVAAGDVYGPVETWNKAYESIALLMPKSIFGKM